MPVIAPGKPVFTQKVQKLLGLDFQVSTTTYLKSPFWWKLGQTRNGRIQFFKDLMSLCIPGA
jgi:hypothetical protein